MPIELSVMLIMQQHHMWNPLNKKVSIRILARKAVQRAPQCRHLVSLSGPLMIIPWTRTVYVGWLISYNMSRWRKATESEKTTEIILYAQQTMPILTMQSPWNWCCKWLLPSLHKDHLTSPSLAVYFATGSSTLVILELHHENLRSMNSLILPLFEK